MQKNPFKGVQVFFIAYFALLILVLTFVGIMGWLGYEMIDASIKFVLFGLLAGSAMIAGTWWVVKRIWRKWLKIAVGAGLTALVLVIFLVMYMALSFLLISATPLPYAYIGSPGGQNTVILRQVSNDAALAEQRMIAAGEDPSNGPQSEDDLGYRYSAYPTVLNFFYNKKANAQGSLEIGMASAAELKYEWTDDNTLCMTIENPQAGDEGEFLLQLN